MKAIKTPTPESEVKKAIRKAKYEFNDDELKNLGLKLAGQVASKRNLENEKKQVVSQITAKITEKVAQIEETQLLLTSGFEYRDIECTVEIDWETAKKNYFNSEKELVDSEALSAEDYQYKLKVDNAAAEESALVVENDKGKRTPISSRKSKSRGHHNEPDFEDEEDTAI